MLINKLYSMKSLGSLLLLYVSLSSFVLSTPDDGVVDLYIDSYDLIFAEESVCIPVTADDFEAVSFAQIPLRFDQEKLQFNSIINEYFPGSVNVPDQNAGTIRYIMQDPTLESPLTIPDCGTLFDVCFDVADTALDESSVRLEDIEDVPPPFILSILSQDGYELSTEVNVGNCNANLDSVFFCLDEPMMAIGSEVCFNLTTQQFSLIQSFQFAIDYDIDELLYLETNAFNTDMGITASNFNTPDTGSIRISWFDQTGQGISVEDCATVAQVCFEVLQVPDASPAIMISNNLPNGIEVTDSDNTFLGLGTGCNCVLDNLSEWNEVEFSISPNPVKNYIQIDWPRKGFVDYTILDMRGHQVLANQSILNSAKINLESLPVGVYIIQLEDSQGKGSKKFVKY